MLIKKHQRSIPGTFWFDRFDVQRKMVNGEEMTERNPSLSGIDRTVGDGTEKFSFRAGKGIAVATASRKHSGFDEASGHFSPQKPVKIKRAGYISRNNDFY